MTAARRALISLSDKRGLLELARALHQLGFAILSTGGTAKALREAAIPVTEVSAVTGFPEILDGRVKTLHPKIHGGILARRALPAHQRELEAHGIGPIDLVAVNLYPFEATIRDPQATLEAALEQIDIGGPTLLRAAAKNFPEVVVVVDPEDYPSILKELQEGPVSLPTRRRLAQKAFAHTARYDSVVADYLGKQGGSRFPAVVTLRFDKLADLRYGENPHQAAALYREAAVAEPSIATAKLLQGKALSFNNVLDAASALELVKEFVEPAAVIVKHNNPCGAALGGRLAEAYRLARATDPVSAFGGVIAFNRRVDQETAQEIAATFVEVVVAPGIDAAAQTLLAQKPNLRVLDLGIGANVRPAAEGLDFKRIAGGLLLQDRDLGSLPDLKTLAVPTKRAPSEEEYRALAFAWKVCKHVKSNAIVYATAAQTIGIGAGQMSRVDSVRLAAMKAAQSGLSVKGTALASDAFFPFRDGIDEAAKAGCTAVIQPGGSVKDREVIAAADEHGLAMVFTGMRHFRH